MAQAADVLQPLGSGHPVPDHGAPPGGRQDGEAQRDAEGHAALADALQAAGKHGSCQPDTGLGPFLLGTASDGLVGGPAS